MARAKPEVEWVYHPSAYYTWGLINLSGKWAVVRANPWVREGDAYDIVTDWVDDKKTAIGFFKLLKE